MKRGQWHRLVGSEYRRGEEGGEEEKRGVHTRSGEVWERVRKGRQQRNVQKKNQQKKGKRWKVEPQERLIEEVMEWKMANWVKVRERYRGTKTEQVCMWRHCCLDDTITPAYFCTSSQEVNYNLAFPDHHVVFEVLTITHLDVIQHD